MELFQLQMGENESAVQIKSRSIYLVKHPRTWSQKFDSFSTVFLFILTI